MNINNVRTNLYRYFEVEDRCSDIWKEIRGGLATFLTMSYILLVNPQILSKIGVNPTDVVTSTAISSAIASILAGCFGNLPLGLAPGMGFSAYLTYGLILGEGLTIKEAYTSCFTSGVLLSIFSVTGISQFIMRLIPRSVKQATIVGMGLQIALVGFTSVNFVVSNPQTVVGLGSLDNYKIWLSFSGLILIGTLLYHEISGAILIGIIILTLISWRIEDNCPEKWSQLPAMESKITDFVDFTDFNFVKCMPGILAFIFIGIIDVSGVIFGMSSLADQLTVLRKEPAIVVSKLTQEDGSVAGALYAFLAASVGTMVSAMTGGTPIIVYVESAAGIKEGGRTGITAIVIGILFFVSLFLAPLFASIPVVATSPVAILVGAMMMSQATDLDWNNMSEAIPAFLTLTIMPLTFSITNGIVCGLMAAFLFYVTTGQFFRDIKSGFRSTSQAPSSLELSPLNKHDRMDENTDSGDNQVQPGFLDTRPPLKRTCSLILPKRDADVVTEAPIDSNYKAVISKSFPSGSSLRLPDYEAVY